MYACYPWVLRYKISTLPRSIYYYTFSLMKVVTELNSKEVVMEFVTYLLGIGEDVEASAVMQVLKDLSNNI